MGTCTIPAGTLVVPVPVVIPVPVVVVPVPVIVPIPVVVVVVVVVVPFDDDASSLMCMANTKNKH
jgi:hypothetical protein